MKYRKGIPEVSHWYWLKDDPGWEGPYSNCKAVYVSVEKGTYRDDGCDWKISDDDEFAGPIPGPEEEE